VSAVAQTAPPRVALAKPRGERKPPSAHHDEVLARARAPPLRRPAAYDRGHQEQRHSVTASEHLVMVGEWLLALAPWRGQENARRRVLRRCAHPSSARGSLPTACAGLDTLTASPRLAAAVAPRLSSHTLEASGRKGMTLEGPTAVRHQLV